MNNISDSVNHFPSVELMCSFNFHWGFSWNFYDLLSVKLSELLIPCNKWLQIQNKSSSLPFATVLWAASIHITDRENLLATALGSRLHGQHNLLCHLKSNIDSQMGNLWILTEKKQHECEKLLSWEARESFLCRKCKSPVTRTGFSTQGMLLSMAKGADTDVAGYWRDTRTSECSNHLAWLSSWLWRWKHIIRIIYLAGDTVFICSLQRSRSIKWYQK